MLSVNTIKNIFLEEGAHESESTWAHESCKMTL